GAGRIEWQSMDGVWQPAGGAIGPTFQRRVGAADNGLAVRAVFSNARGVTTSEPATITVVSRAAAHDFNGDGNADLLWRHRGSGALAVWCMDGRMLVDIVQVDAAQPEGDLLLAGTGDFDGDGRND